MKTKISGSVFHGDDHSVGAPTKRDFENRAEWRSAMRGPVKQDRFAVHQNNRAVIGSEGDGRREIPRAHNPASRDRDRILRVGLFCRDL